MSPEMVEILSSMGMAGGVTGVLSMLLLHHTKTATQERADWLKTMQNESAETRATLNELKEAVVDLRVAIAARNPQT